MSDLSTAQWQVRLNFDTSKYDKMISFLFSFAGILSAYGLALADVVHEAQEPCARAYNKGKTPVIPFLERIQ